MKLSLIHSVLSNFSAFADLGLFQFPLQEFKHGESWRSEKKSPKKKVFSKVKDFEMVR